VTGDVAKLPRWAQQHIEVLETHLAEARAELAKVGNPDLTDTFVDRRPWQGDDSRYDTLAEGAQITWWPYTGWPQAKAGRLTAHWEKPDRSMPGHLRIAGSGSSSRRLVVLPQVANVVLIMEVAL
jgi:hypothetical protein